MTSYQAEELSKLPHGEPDSIERKRYVEKARALGYQMYGPEDTELITTAMLKHLLGGGPVGMTRLGDIFSEYTSYDELVIDQEKDPHLLHAAPNIRWVYWYITGGRHGLQMAADTETGFLWLERQMLNEEHDSLIERTWPKWFTDQYEKCARSIDPRPLDKLNSYTDDWQQWKPKSKTCAGCANALVCHTKGL